jgi:hypothetical protein
MEFHVLDDRLLNCVRSRRRRVEGVNEFVAELLSFQRISLEMRCIVPVPIPREPLVPRL